MNITKKILSIVIPGIIAGCGVEKIVEQPIITSTNYCLDNIRAEQTVFMTQLHANDYAPGTISPQQADRLNQQWRTLEYSKADCYEKALREYEPYSN